MSEQKLNELANDTIKDELDDDEFVDARETVDEEANDFKALDKTHEDTSGELSDAETVVDDEDIDQDLDEKASEELSETETVVDDDNTDQDLDDDFDDAESFVSAFDVDPKIAQQMAQEKIPEDITKEELYIIRSALEETNRIKKIQAEKDAELSIEHELQEKLTSQQVDQKLDQYVKLKEKKKEAELRGDIQAQIDIKYDINYQRGNISILPDKWELYEQEMKDYNEKYDRIWDMWLERYDKVKYDGPKEINDLTRIKKYIHENGLSLPQKESKLKKIWENIKWYTYGRFKQKYSWVKKMEKYMLEILSIPIDIKNSIIETRNKLFKEPQEREILNALNNIDNMLSKDKKNKVLLQERENLVKLRYKYKIFRDDIKRYSDNYNLKQVLDKNIKNELNQINSRINKISKDKKSVDNYKLSSKHLEIKDNTINNDIIKSNKIELERQNDFSTKKDIPQERASKPKGRELP